MRRWTVGIWAGVLATGLSVTGVSVADAQDLTCTRNSDGVIVCPATGSPRTQLQTATFIAGSEATGATLAQAVALEVSTAPLGSSSGGFVYTFDEATRGHSRTSTMFGPTFAERALTIGKGKWSGGVNFLHRSYDEFGGLDLDDFQVFTFQGGSSVAARTADMNLKIETDTVAMFGHVGLSDNLDVGVLVPYVKMSISGTSRIFIDPQSELQRVLFGASSSGIGDVALFTKYRFAQFGPDAREDAPANGALAVAATVRLPTGDEEELLGLGIGRGLFSLIGSASLGRWSPHANVGYEFWTSRVDVPRDFQNLSTLSAKAQIHYAGGAEFEITRKLTVIGDVLGRYLRGTGQVAYQQYAFPENVPRIQGADALVADPNGVHSIFLVPSVKWNVFQDALVTVSVIAPITKGGLRDHFTPVIGIDWGF